jgi:hypothetical protein
MAPNSATAPSFTAGQPGLADAQHEQQQPTQPLRRFHLDHLEIPLGELAQAEAEEAAADGEEAGDGEEGSRHGDDGTRSTGYSGSRSEGDGAGEVLYQELQGEGLGEPPPHAAAACVLACCSLRLGFGPL